MPPEERASTRPVILGRIAPPRAIPPRRGGGGRAQFTDPDTRGRRIDAQFDAAMAAIGDQVRISDSIQAADPQLVLVFEALDEQINLTNVAEKLGIEVLLEAEDAVLPTDDVRLTTDKPRNPFIASCLHAVCMNQTALDNLLSLWRAWRANRELPRGYSPLRDLFSHLKDVRPWGPQDRLQTIDWDEYFEGRIDDRLHSIEIELWYRRSPVAREKSQREVAALVEQAGGRVARGAVIDQIGFHGLKCEVPTALLRELAAGNFDGIRLVRSANVMYLRVTGQSVPIVGPSIEIAEEIEDPLPGGDPVLCLLDGVPMSNHRLLRDRVIVYDPDDLSRMATVDERRHGTWTASIAVWGDRGSNQAPATRPVLVRPVLVPSDETANRTEELQSNELVPDLMWRVFRELFEDDPSGPAAAPTVAVVNISVGDPAVPFETVLSSWARMLDWLSFEYGVLVVISAGNQGQLSLSPLVSTDLTGAVGVDRRQVLLEAIDRGQNERRMLAPAESVNAITVGATHDDSSDAVAQGYLVDPADGFPSISPVTAMGSGYRRSIKPDLMTPGGRAFYSDAAIAQDVITFRGTSPRGPGLKVATPAGNNETHVVGTSFAAASVSRQAARLHDLVDEIAEGPATRRQRAAAIKALLVHGTVWPPEMPCDPLAPEIAIGNGVLVRDYSDGCASNEAVVLYMGSIRASEEQELLFPLPDGLNVRETKRIDATLAWLTPVNWRSRQYRCASLSFVTPSGAIPSLGAPAGHPSAVTTRGAATVQHQSWELEKTFASGQGSDMNIRVKCYEQAGGLGGRAVDFAVAVSMWVAPTINVDVYSQVRDQVRARVAVRPQ
ncbi:S8 family peptidase [Mycolicibacterium fortuitum]|uniref:S8 family peptidase n=1 Tax=Mycolicibacterium fortuitum TaxID=1766 RepID=UPI001AEF47FF|nr:S8 family peptidase [Mycolicibacterium fortuitum]MBP3083107.1 S8 family peptidase [Mycolicibacterium fortuitum]